MPVADKNPSPTLTDLLFQKAGIGLCLVAPDDTVVRANAEWLRSTGFTEEQVVGSNLVELFPDTRDMAVRMHAWARDGHRVEVPRRAQAVNGRETWWEGSIEPVPMESGTGLLITAREVVLRALEDRRCTKEALRESEERFRLLASAMPHIVCVLRPDGTPEYVNPTWIAFSGLDAEATARAGWDRVVHPDDLAAARECRLRVFKQLTPQEVELRYRAADGTFRWFLSRVAPVVEGGRVVRFIGAGMEIEGRKRAEVALRESEARFRLALRNAPVSVAAQDRELRYVWAYNQRTATPDEIIGKRDEDLFTAEEAALVTAFKRRVLNEGIEIHQQKWFDRPSGRIFLDVHWEPIRDEAGQVVGVASATVDFTQRKRADEELAIVSRLYAVLSRVNEAIVRTRDERALYAEVCRIVAEQGGFPLVWVGLVNGRRVEPVAASGRAVDYVHEIRVEVDGELGQGPSGTCIRENRTVINDDFDVNPATKPWRAAALEHGLRASASFALHRRGTVIGTLTLYAERPGTFTPQHVELVEALCADLSYALDAIDDERRRTQAERALRESEQHLREADRRKDEFLGMLSHELRNPLAPIRNSSYVLRHAAPGSEQARRAQGVIERQTDHLTRLVDDLLDVTRIARGKIELRRDGVDLREIVARAAEDFLVLMRDRRVRFHVDIPDEKLWADADPTRITQIVGNLLHNASKFTRSGNEVRLSLARTAADAAEIRVRDTGTGIDAALLPRLFEPFVQGERTLARSEGGLGLGLALVRGIAELHGGTVRAESAGVGLGAEFIVRLPLASPVSVPAGVGPRAQPSGGARRVLVVDDNRDAAESLADIVQMLGYATEYAYDGPSAIEKARTNPPDVVLCDIGLPGMSGYEVAKSIREELNSNVQLFAVSGYAQPEDVKRAIEAGFDGHVAKPCDPEAIERLLS